MVSSCVRRYTTAQVLETTRAMRGANDEVVISYDPQADNRELMMRYGFSLRGNRNERVPRPPAPDPAATAVVTPAPLRAALEEKGVITEDTPAEERARLVLAVGSACGGLGSVGGEEEEKWELDEDDVAREAAAAGELRRAWSAALDAFDTPLSEDTAMLTAARAGSLPGATANVVCALEYRVERKRMLTTAVGAMDAYVAWLEEDDQEEEEEEKGEEEEMGEAA